MEEKKYTCTRTCAKIHSCGSPEGNKKRKDRTFYNDRLEYAQRQARRREKKDWKENMTQREGYTY